LGRFEILKDDQPLQFKGKVQRKPLALLKAIIAFGGRAVSEELLIDTLWPDAEGDGAHFALTSTIHRLRRLLGREEAIIRKDNKVSLDDRYCWVDVWAVERLLTRAEESRGVEGDRNWSETIRAVQRAAEVYRGPFLGGDTDSPWVIPLNDRLRRQVLRQLVHVGQHVEHNEQWQQAIDYYEKAMAVDPCAEDVCRSLMIAYHHLGRPGDVLATYNHCRDALANRLGTGPSAATENLLKRLQTYTTAPHS
jgi:LuxR family maltose regulon positive regulatory protein